MISQPIERKFVKPSSISEYLKCPICLQVFQDATRLYCGHTFCEKCLNDYMKDGRNCPECRTAIDKSNIGIDLLARQIINQLEVFCSQEDCPWKGILQQLQSHCLEQCIFYGKTKEEMKKVKKNQKIIWHQRLDDDVIDKINEHTVKGSLEARILVKTDSSRDVIPLKQCKTSSSNTEPKLKQKRGRNNRKQLAQNQPKKPQPRTSNFDFLQSLFE